MKLQRLESRAFSCVCFTEGVTVELLGQRCVLSAFLSGRDACLGPHPSAAAPHIRTIVRSAAPKKNVASSHVSRRAGSPSFFPLAFEFDHAETRWKVRTEAGRQAAPGAD